jgi:hypothetical protein
MSDKNKNNDELNKTAIDIIDLQISNDLIVSKKTIKKLPFTIEERYQYFQCKSKCLDIIINSNETFTSNFIEKLTKKDLIKYIKNIENKIFKKQILTEVEKFNFILCKFLYLFQVKITNLIAFNFYNDFINLIKKKEKNENEFFDFGMCDKILNKLEQNPNILVQFIKYSQIPFLAFICFLIDPNDFYNNNINIILQEEYIKNLKK